MPSKSKELKINSSILTQKIKAKIVVPTIIFIKFVLSKLNLIFL